jgi:hypothetical protein
MDQDPLPRGSSQIADRLGQVGDTVLELTQAAVAVEAENATYITEHVIVVDVPRVGRAADRTDSAPTGQERIELLLPDLVLRRRWYSRVPPCGRWTVSRRAMGLTSSQPGHHFIPAGTSTWAARRAAIPRFRRLVSMRCPAHVLR